jgi:Ca2+-binding EF-hand superfamily protein
LSKRPADGETERDIKSMVKSISTSIEDKRIRGLREIFGFYSQQHLPQGLMFGDILAKQDNLDLGEFLMFTRDFQIPLNKKKIIEVFKKTSSLRQLPVSFDEFCEVLNKVSIELNIEKINAVK